jgi:uncharacterized protein
MARFNYVELPTRDIAKAKRFYADAFGFEINDFGPGYAATVTGDTDIGFNATGEHVTAHVLAVIAAGGTISLDIFPFPGGRRFHFVDLEGHELSAVKGD